MNMIEQLFNDYSAKYLEEAKKNSVDLGLQTVYTPIDKIEKATNFRFADYITSETRSVAVLFNTEFIGYFIKELPQNYINNIKFTFFYDCEFDYKQVRNFILFSGKRLNVDFVKIENIKDFDKVMPGKNFDIVFSNPPYSGIDLKILESMFSKNIADSFVWIAPIRWLQDPLAKYKKRTTFKSFLEKGICQKIQKFKIIKGINAYHIFNAQFNYDIGILLIDKNSPDSDIYTSIFDNTFLKIFEKIYKHCNTIMDYVDEKCVDGWRVKVSLISGGRFLKNGINDRRLFYQDQIYYDGLHPITKKYWTECQKTKNRFSKNVGDPIPTSIKFKNENECKNFQNSCENVFLHFLNYNLQGDVHVPLQFLPCMIEETNPRTGLKGYEGEWTNEDFYKFFGITEEEQKYIEETMSQFK